MRKLLISFFAAVAGLMLLAVPAMAASTVSVNVEQPKTPNNQREFNVNFVALTTTGNVVTVKCFKQAPGEASFTQFGSDIVLSSGGNTDNCLVTSSITTTDGTYAFYVSADDGTNSVTSNTVTVNLDTSYPDAPTGYGKTKVDSCNYKINFHTASDNGKTVKVEVYRSDSTTFNADSGTRVASISIGSNSDGNYTSSVPDCNKTYYFVIRAFNAAGNGSGIVGDSEVHITTINPTSTQHQGAIPVTNGTVNGNTQNGSNTSSSVLGTQTTTDQAKDNGNTKKGVLGDETKNNTEAAKSFLSSKTGIAVTAFAALIVLGLLFFMWRKMKKSS